MNSDMKVAGILLTRIRAAIANFEEGAAMLDSLQAKEHLMLYGSMERSANFLTVLAAELLALTKRMADTHRKDMYKK